MRAIVAALALVLPLVIAPGLLFFDDVTPKTVTILLGAAACLGWWMLRPTEIMAVAANGRGKRFLSCIAAWAAITLITTIAAHDPELAWTGSTWRGYGALTQFALLAIGVAAAGVSFRDGRALDTFCRALCVSGIAAGMYGILQYAGIDPLLSGFAYHAGEGPFEIVRPPSTLGHADYFAAFLLWPAFAGTHVRGKLGYAATVTAGVAIVLSGSRGALLGLVAGGVLWVALMRPRARFVAYSSLAAFLILVLFAVSPAGAHLRARLHWIGEEPAGGARLLLWRDTLKMAADAPLAGFGRENFIAEFPKYQSVDLSRAYPDFYHESPHNIVLDALAGEGILGLIAMALTIAFGGYRALVRARTGSQRDAALLAALAAALVAHQFIVLTPPTAFCLIAVVAMLAVERSDNEPFVEPEPARILPRVAAGAVACSAIAFLTITAYRAGARDFALASIRRDIDAGQVVHAAARFEHLHYRPAPAELYMSRRFAAAAKSAPTAVSKLLLVRAANRAAERATLGSEQKANAWYNLAAFAATSNDAVRTEAALRQAIRFAPNWFKPHWAMARLMQVSGRPSEASAEARRALALNGGKHAEVSATLAFASTR
jgi:O-antigen ligase